MRRNQVLDLQCPDWIPQEFWERLDTLSDEDFLRLERDPKTASRMWKLLLLLALKDGADALWLRTREGEPEMGYRIDGEDVSLEPPPRGIVAEMVEQVRGLSAPAGIRAWIAGKLRGLARRIENQHWADHRSEFDIGLGVHSITVETAPAGFEGIFLRLAKICDSPADVQAAFWDCCRRWDFWAPPLEGDAPDGSGRPELRPD